MKIYYTVGLSMLAGAVLGAGAIQGLHAQAKPPGFVIAEIDVSNPDAFAKEFAPLAVKALGENDSGYKALARGGKVVVIEGDAPKRIVINQFADMDKALAAYNSPDYKAAKVIGDKYAKFRLIAVEGLPQ
jgi:uncharacterized protein (DUF1330 family)